MPSLTALRLCWYCPDIKPDVADVRAQADRIMAFLPNISSLGLTGNIDRYEDDDDYDWDSYLQRLDCYIAGSLFDDFRGTRRVATPISKSESEAAEQLPEIMQVGFGDTAFMRIGYSL